VRKTDQRSGKIMMAAASAITSEVSCSVLRSGSSTSKGPHRALVVAAKRVCSAK
jgi:hypothetical protein